MSRPSSRAVSSHSVITVSAFASASCRVVPSAAQPGSSGTSAINAWSSSLQYRMISYLVIEPLQPVYTGRSPRGPAFPGKLWKTSREAAHSGSPQHLVSQRCDDYLQTLTEPTGSQKRPQI